MTSLPIESIFRQNLCYGRVAIITGGGSGIGYEIARELGKHGTKVMIMGRRENILQDAVNAFIQEGIDASYYCGDVRKNIDANSIVDKAVATYGHVDTLINAAAGNFLVTAENLSTKGFKTVLDIDAVGTFNMCRAAFPQLEKSKRGRIINISANLHLSATWYQVHASAAKAAIDSITRSLALEWGCYGITVNGIAPGPIRDTPGLAKLGPDISDDDKDAMVGSYIPIGRMGTKSEIAAITLFLLSCGLITGHVVLADGGEWLYKEPVLPKEMIAQHSRQQEKKSRQVGLPPSRY